MKKTIAILSLIVIATACGSNATTETTTDTTQAQVDTAAVTATDTTVAHIDAGAAKETPENVK